MSAYHVNFFLFIFSCLATSCSSYKIPTQDVIADSDNPETAKHPLYDVVPRHRCQIRPYDLGHWMTWCFFGNDDEGIFGEDSYIKYKPEYPPSHQRAVMWWCRNPFHNFCHYVIGSSHRRNSEIALIQIGDGNIHCMTYKSQGRFVFADRGPSLFLGFHGGKPFFSMRVLYTPKYKGEIYLGWRDKGNFGIKCSPWSCKVGDKTNTFHLRKEDEGTQDLSLMSLMSLCPYHALAISFISARREGAVEEASAKFKNSF